MKEVIEKYNNGQSEYHVISIKKVHKKKSCLPEYSVHIQGDPMKMEQEANDIGYKHFFVSFNIGFYEWVFNPKYKVFEVFGFYLEFYNSVYLVYCQLTRRKRIDNTPKEILKELSKGVE